MTTVSTIAKPRVMSGMRPTGGLHLGHLVGVLTQWAAYCESADAFFEIADLHAYTTGFEDPESIRSARNEMVAVWLAAGVDPKKSTIFLQSAVPEIAQLHTLLSMITPVSWLERVPTYKGQIDALGQQIATYGFLGYPLLQLCDIAVVRGERVPVGRDQVAHLEFGREVVRRFNFLYGAGEEILIEPQPTLTEFAEIPGTDGRKMSKSYDNAILIADDEETTLKKVRSMITDPQKVRRGDPGRPEICPVFALWKFANPQKVDAVAQGCRSGALGCVADKSDFAEQLNAYLRPVRERLTLYRSNPAYVEAIIAEGTERTRTIAAAVIRDVKGAMKLL
ncbi:MAG TPA: tryptophan--tRNA ligase [Candidatus Baltobacteraceae bacterium]|jgi:tryptophanyl-tRNA synthetase|nr:tryptophan--tRNA ligase [Candidatus Baltobacteraceae bacterium]